MTVTDLALAVGGTVIFGIVLLTVVLVIRDRKKK